METNGSCKELIGKGEMVGGCCVGFIFFFPECYSKTRKSCLKVWKRPGLLPRKTLLGWVAFIVGDSG